MTGDWLRNVGLAAALLAMASHPARACGDEPDLQLVFWKGPQLVRLDVRFEVDDKPLSAIWDDKISALVKFWDRDNNGFLSEPEAKRLPSVASLREVIATGFTPPLGVAPEFKELDADGNAMVSTAEVKAFYRRAGLARPQVGAGAMPFSKELTTALVELLDADGDKTVDVKELQTAAALVGKLDRNDDELVGAGELVARILYPGIAGGALLLPPNRAAAEAETLPASYVLLPANPTDDAWARVLVRGRDKNQDGKLSAEEAGLPEKTFQELDQDADGSLTAADLRIWRESEPEQSCTINLAANYSAPPHFSSGDNDAKAAAWKTTSGGLQLLMRADDGRLKQARERIAEYFTDMFTRADENNDANVTAEEASTARSDWKWFLPAADRNENGELSREELEGWLALQTKLAEGEAMLTILEAGQGLFELLDTNHDGALSLPEFTAAAGQLESSGCLVDGKLDMGRLPSTYLITVSQGYPQSPLGKQERTGPAWFLAMDRNADGVVSPREFSGSADVFAELDRDGNRFLTVEEASAKK